MSLTRNDLAAVFLVGRLRHYRSQPLPQASGPPLNAVGLFKILKLKLLLQAGKQEQKGKIAMIRLLHRYQVALDTNFEPSQYGFNATQFSFNSDNAANPSTLINAIKGVLSNGLLDDLGFYLQIEIAGDDIWSNLSSFPPGTNGVVARETWYSNANADWYNKIISVINAVKADATLGSKLRGVRWNHEFRPVIFTRNNFWTWAANHQASTGCANATTVQQLYLSQWTNTFLPYVANTGISQPFYADPDNNDSSPGVNIAVRRLYRCLVDYQCEVEATIIGILSDRIKNDVFGGSNASKFIVYPGNSGVSIIYPVSEYTLNYQLVPTSKDNIVWEAASWDWVWNGSSWVDSQSTAQWLYDQVNPLAQAGRPFFFTMQERKEKNPFDVSTTIYDFTRRRRGLVTPTFTPWDNSFGFWTDWTTGTPGNANAAAEVSYIARVRDGLA